MIAVPLLVLGIFAAVSLNKAKSRLVYVVNGSPAPYAVSIDGDPGFMVTPGHPPAIPMAEGDHNASRLNYRMVGTKRAERCPPGNFRVRGTFFGRPFSRTAFVLNPDGLAWSSARCTCTGNVSTAPSAEILPPSTFTAQPKVRHPFTTPPQQISTQEQR